ncbi:MAG TPA: alginate export family protein, partial [Vicinamibacterales bacterium]|nr:alginate export family protein [Vicinamibacterales bacterium]
NVRYNDNKRLDASLIYAGAVRSTTAYKVPDGRDLRREGLRVINPRLKWDGAFGVPGLWVEGEVGREWHADFEMSAYASGAWAGYRFQKAAWKPAVLYRYSVFSGDDPATPAYERFDSLLGGVQRDWLQGLVMVKLANNANLEAHRFEASVRPRRGMELLVDVYRFRARESNNLGGGRPFQTWPSRDLGYEITPTLQWSITPNLFLQALVSVKVSGAGMAAALPAPARSWATFQASLYAGF